MRDPVDAVFSALADPSRRFVVQTLAARGTATPTELAADLPVTRQAVAKHLAALRSAGLVEASRAGREMRYALTPAPLASAVEWIEDVGAAWDERLAALKRLVEHDAHAKPAVPGKGRGRGEP
jgi:DNA-binding transcriptional ArsR family regulator